MTSSGSQVWKNCKTDLSHLLSTLGNQTKAIATNNTHSKCPPISMRQTQSRHVVSFSKVGMGVGVAGGAVIPLRQSLKFKLGRGGGITVYKSSFIILSENNF